ncbi:MAG: hypothetical protein ACI8XO_003830 [Verrucomicrobiales bacterium]|jgi:hypothetical protein
MKFTASSVTAALAVVALAATAEAATVASAANADWLTFVTPNYTTWTGSALPGSGDTASIDHTVRADISTSVTNDVDEITAASVQVNSGGTLNLWGGRMTLDAFSFNGGTLTAAQRTMIFRPTTIAVNDVPGNVWGQSKNQNSKHAEIHTPTITGSGDITVMPGHSGQLFQLDVTDPSGTAGFTGKLDVTRQSGRYDTGNQSDSAWLKINQNVTQGDASFSMSLNGIVRDWTEAGGGTAATDDGISYNGYDMRDVNSEVWLNDLTIGGFSVPGRATAYTYAELAAMNGGDVANYLRTDGTDGLLGVAVPEPSTLMLLDLAGLAMLGRRRS